ncbi:MAG: FHA domain-containing protein [Planctomycetota bacterium]|nr:FHA domain-containing protein [Planctomycetota bacterium]
MNDNPLAIEIARRIDQLISTTRLHDIALLLHSDREQRVGNLAQSIALLEAGGYIIGCGPYNCGLMKVTVDEITIGRPASPMERPAEGIADFQMNDAIWLRPREVSRIHATIIRQRHKDVIKYFLRDERSTMGTYLNGKRLQDEPGSGEISNPAVLETFDQISLGPSGINSFIFVIV